MDSKIVGSRWRRFDFRRINFLVSPYSLHLQNQVSCSRELDFFPGNNFSYASKRNCEVALLANLSNLETFPHGLVVTRMPLYPKVLGSSLGRTLFFFSSCMNWKMSDFHFSAYVLSAQLPHRGIYFAVSNFYHMQVFWFTPVVCKINTNSFYIFLGFPFFFVRLKLYST